MKPIFSIISPTLNGRAFLPRHIASVRSQEIDQGEVEHWIIDGNSNDGTVEYLQNTEGIHYLSEPDRGLSHAVNKGIERARGEWLIWLNVDDELAPGALKSFLEAIHGKAMPKIVCGAQEVRNYAGQRVSVSQPQKYTFDGLLRNKTEIIQASTFVHRDVYAAIGGMDESFRFAMDYEWMVRAAKQFPCGVTSPILTVYHRRRGSITDLGIAQQHREFLRVRRMHGCSIWEPMEWRLRFYLATEPLRKIDSLRTAIQAGKRHLRSPKRPAHATRSA